MASGQGPGPPRQGCEEEPDPSSTSEEQVARDTEEVFRSYVFYRHQQEQEAEGAAAPTDPEMVTLSLEPSSTMGQVGRQLAIIGDDINRRYDSEFQAMLQHLQPTAENAYEYFTKIASSLFESGINWGRVVALLGFGYRLALHVYQRGLTGFLGQVTRFVADFMLHHCIARWIAQRGGWAGRGTWTRLAFTWFLLTGLISGLLNPVEGWVCFSSLLEGLGPSPLFSSPFSRNDPHFFGFQASFPSPQSQGSPNC
ncbi:bcl-2 homologous antagonist/killer isoform X1 [Globicephala melas]|uniref:bcl-2 homologous antagonist/killer isoform X1 n=1 Tax=Globicephala melas TaxID=9731 RepID=UPI00293D27C4|nr:bcl-2 homologous antagonist/killer isoform X1 [Globicephala melas]